MNKTNINQSVTGERSPRDSLGAECMIGNCIEEITDNQLNKCVKQERLLQEEEKTSTL